MGSKLVRRQMKIETQTPTRIGYLSGQHVLCMDCAPAAPRNMVPVYSDNLGRYNQSCHQCGKAIHITPPYLTWGVELWDSKDCRQCQ